MRYLICFLLGSFLTFIIIVFIFFSTTGFSIGDRIQFRSDLGDFEFTTIPSKGRDFEMMERAFIDYKVKMKLNDEVNIYRVTKKNYFNISKWCSYKSMREWQYPYKSF